MKAIQASRPALGLLAALILGALAGAAQAKLAKPAKDFSRVDVLSIGGYVPVLSSEFLMPFEHMLRGHSADIQVEGVEHLPATYKATVYLLNLPQESSAAAQALGEPGQAVSARALENMDGYFVFSPPQPHLMDEFLRAAQKYPLLPPTEQVAASLHLAQEPTGLAEIVSIYSGFAAAEQQRSTLATVYHLKISGKPVDAVFFYKTRGGLGRLASALQSLDHGTAPAIVVSRGNWEFRGVPSTLHGQDLYDELGALGLQVSAVGRGDIGHWQELQRYVARQPTGTRYISANIVFSTDADSTALPASSVIEAGGVKVGFIGLTRAGYSKYLGRGPLRSLTMADPIESARKAVRALRAQADIIIVLSNMDATDNARLRNQVRGIDAIVADSEEYAPEGQETNVIEASSVRRGPFSPCLFVASEYDGIDRLELSVGPKDESGYYSLGLKQSQIVLDEAYADKPGLPAFSADEFAAASSTFPVLIPAARALFPNGNPYSSSSFPRLVDRDFWTLSASLAADKTHSEAGLIPVTAINADIAGDFTEPQVRNWFGWGDNLVTFEMSGSGLGSLLDEVQAQEEREKKGLPPVPGQLRLAAGGIGPGGTIHGIPIDPTTVYRVAGTELLLGDAQSYLALAGAKNVQTVGDLQGVVINSLKSHAGQWSPERYVELMNGQPVHETSLWLLNFRDMSFNVSGTNVVKENETFSQVPNPRVQAYNQQTVGATAKVDASYLWAGGKWTNTVEAQYTEADLHPPDQPAVINFPDNRLMAQSIGTMKVGSFPLAWLGDSFGPSVGIEYDGQIRQSDPSLNRQDIYSVLPGIQIYNGSIIQSLQIAGNLKRDYSVNPPSDQYGARLQAVSQASIPLGIFGSADFNGEMWGDYFASSPHDTPQDLRMDLDLNAKISFPIWKSLSIAPFIDFYLFELKTTPIYGYSMISGISLSFSRLWKPQYEKF